MWDYLKSVLMADRTAPGASAELLGRKTPQPSSAVLKFIKPLNIKEKKSLEDFFFKDRIEVSSLGSKP